MGYKKKPKNKEALSAKSGVRPKPVYRDRVIFEFETEGKMYRNDGEGRLKLDHKGYFTFVIKKEGVWSNVKGHLRKLKLVRERKIAGVTKGNV